MTPAILFYTIGKLEILKLRDDYKKQEGANFSLKKFHDEIAEPRYAAVILA